LPNRIIKESICTSDSIAELSWFEEVLFYRLIVNCDDFGRYDGRVPVIKNRLFPLKEDLTAKAVKSALTKLASVGLVALYEFEGKPYLHLPTWNDHQSARATKSKYPDPESGTQIDESNCMQLQADASKCPRIRIRNTNSYSINESVSDAFARWWECYPKKVGKEAARKAFEKVKAEPQVLIDAVERQKGCEQWRKENGRYIPNPATWLNQGRWEDEVDSVNTDGRRGLDSDELAAIRRIMED
jgi:hypothetical protein